MMAHIMLGSARLGNPLLKAVILKLIHCKTVIPFTKLNIPVLLENQPCHDIINEKCAERNE